MGGLFVFAGTGSSGLGLGTRLKREEDHEEADGEGKAESGAQGVAAGRDDTDEPREHATSNASGTEKESADPGGIVAKDGGEPGDEDGILRSEAKSSDGCADVQDVRRT